MRTLLDGREDVFGEARAKDRDAMPLGLRDPFVFRILPGALGSDEQYGEFRTIAARLALLWIGPDESD